MQVCVCIWLIWHIHHGLVQVLSLSCQLLFSLLNSSGKRMTLKAFSNKNIGLLVVVLTKGELRGSGSRRTITSRDEGGYRRPESRFMQKVISD